MNEQAVLTERDFETMRGGIDKVERFKWVTKDRKGKFIYISKGLLRFDHLHYQRADIVEAKILEIARAWSWVACGAISVASRANEYFVMDGQYRTLAALRRCMVFQVDDIKGEAEAFLRVNAHRKPITSRDKFKAQLTTDDPQATFVQRLLVESNRGISNSNNRSARCLSSLLRWARIRPDILQRIWPVIDAVCGSHAIHVHIVDGFMQLEMQLSGGDSLAEARWRERLVAIGMDELLDSAHKAQAFRGKGGGKAFAEGILARLNRGLRNTLKISNPA